MKKSILLVCLAVFAPATAFAGSTIVIKDPTGPTTKNVSNTKIINNSTITGGSQTGLKVTGSNNTVVNNGTITGTTGVSMSGSGSSSFTNTGTIKATSTGTSSASAVGVSIK